MGFWFWKKILILSQHLKGKNKFNYKKKLTLSLLENLKSSNSNKFKIVMLYMQMFSKSYGSREMTSASMNFVAIGLLYIMFLINCV